METFFRLSTRERWLQFMYLLAAIGTLSVLISWIAFRNYAYSNDESKRLSDKIRQREQILENQLQHMQLLDSAYRSIVAYQPQIKAIFVEEEIDHQLNEIRRLSNPQTDGTQFKSFTQIADFYKMMYTDKKVIYATQFNSTLFRTQLDNCSVGRSSPAPGPSGTAPSPNSGQ